MNIKIGPLAYAVEIIKDLKSDDGRELFGEIDYTPQIIRLEESMTPERSRIALWHEILHGIDQCYCLGLGEQGVATLGMIMAQLLIDNPGLANNDP